MMDALFNSAQGQAVSVQQQFQDLWQSVKQNLTSQIDFQLSQFNSSQNNACTNNLTQQYYSIGNNSRKYKTHTIIHICTQRVAAQEVRMTEQTT